MTQISLGPVMFSTVGGAGRVGQLRRQAVTDRSMERIKVLFGSPGEKVEERDPVEVVVGELRRTVAKIAKVADVDGSDS